MACRPLGRRLCTSWSSLINTLRPRQNGRHFADDFFKCIFLYENVWFSINISLKFFPKGPIKIFRWCHGADQATSHYLNQWWLVYWRIYTSRGLNELTHRPMRNVVLVLEYVIFKPVSILDILSISCSQVIATRPRWFIVNIGYDINGLIPSGQCWPRSLSPYTIESSHWVNIDHLYQHRF